MSEFETIIDLGSKNLRIGIFNSKFEGIYFASQTIECDQDNKNLHNSLSKLIKDAEKKLSTHVEDVNVLYDSFNFFSIDVSIKKKFDQPTSIDQVYEMLIDEAKFIISENNIKSKIIHVVVKKIIVDDNKKLEKIIQNLNIKSLLLEIKFICINKTFIQNILSTFKNINIKVKNIYCSSYVKSHFYKKNFKKFNDYILLDIGFERTSGYIFKSNIFEYFNSIPVGGQNITKDISKVLKLDLDFSEELKIKICKKESQLLIENNVLSDNNIYTKISEKNISIDLLIQIIEARLHEIIELVIHPFLYEKNLNTLNQPKIIFIGGGSKLLSDNFNLNNGKIFSELLYPYEDEFNICDAGIKYLNSDESKLSRAKKKLRKSGFFENFFNLFSK